VNVGWIDCETFSKYNLPDVGTDVYSRNCEIILASFALNDDPVNLWEVGEDPSEVIELLSVADILIAHNVWFEFNVFEHADWCHRPIEDWHCTMAQAYAHCLPAKLEMLCRVLGVAEEDQKKEGKKLINKFCKPQRKGNRLTKEHLPEEWEQFREYAVYDITSMRECYRRMPRVNLNAGVGV
jgi:DNA polymerase